MNGMLDFICLGPVEPRRTPNKQTLQNDFFVQSHGPKFTSLPHYPGCQLSIDVNKEIKVHVMPVKASAHSFKQFTSRFWKLSFSLSMHLYTSDGRHAWFHLHGTSRPARSASEARKYKMKNSCPLWDSNPQPSDLKSDALPTELAGLGECYPFKWPYYIHVLPIPMHSLL